MTVIGVYRSFSRGYVRAGGEISTFLGHPDLEAAVKDALACLTDPEVTRAWVRGVRSDGTLSGALWAGKAGEEG